MWRKGGMIGLLVLTGYRKRCLPCDVVISLFSGMRCIEATMEVNTEELLTKGSSETVTGTNKKVQNQVLVKR
jgi:hypothetical protein